MLEVFFALKAFQIHLLGKHVCVRIDNMTAVSNIGKMGTYHSRKRNTLVREIWDWCIDHNIFLTTAHIPEIENEAADAESRKPLKETEWALDHKIYQQGIQLLDLNPVIDLFASRLNYKVKPFIAYQPDPEAEAIKAFTISWRPYLFHAFPPFSKIPLLLPEISRGGEYRFSCCSKMVAIPDANGNSDASGATKHGEHNTHAEQTRSDPSFISQINVTDVPHFRGPFENRELSQGVLSVILSSWRTSTQKQYVP